MILLAGGYWVEGRAVPHHRRRGEGVTRLHNVTLTNATLGPAMATGGELVLQGYRIDRFGKDMFDLLARTASLTLRKGSIPNVFFASDTLDSFQIDSTGLESFDLNPFPSPNLRILQITRNSLELISPRISYLTGLRTLDLSQNRLTHVELNLFEPMRQLRDLDLSVNRIVRIEAVGKTGQPLTVRNLWVSYNRLVAFDEFPEAFPSLATMRLHGNDWSCPWVDWARGEIMRKGITVFGADYDCSGDRRGGLCCYDNLKSTTENGQPVDVPTLIIENEPNGTIGVKFGEVEIFY
ncbi:AGAP002542-PA-like protein [Anopheles sinensis]|uniref:AGAP002542-PA-like protein n=1 Tax=Anopheles sinensis TaxID=74873 RepID=A0A084VA74_ANOSI|nr:AGAP002542-PA-like protein [Anopheles sinensis]